MMEKEFLFHAFYFYSVCEEIVHTMFKSGSLSISIPCLVITPLSKLAKVANIYRPKDMLTLSNSDTLIFCPPTVSRDRHLSLYFNDINEPLSGFFAPEEKHIIAILDFFLSWKKKSPLLIHCHMGISRSTAAAFIALCVLSPEIEEKKLAKYLRFQSPMATPNRRLVYFADHLLSRHGRMIAAIKHIGRGCNANEGIPFVLDIKKTNMF